MGFFFTVKKSVIILSLIIAASGTLFPQFRPEWTNTQKSTIGTGFYYGIGVSQSNSDEADTRAFLEFARNVEVKVKSTFQREVNEEGKEFSDRTILSMEMISDVSLKGIAVTERYTDTTSATFYSLIKLKLYTKERYLNYETPEWYGK